MAGASTESSKVTNLDYQEDGADVNHAREEEAIGLGGETMNSV